MEYPWSMDSPGFFPSIVFWVCSALVFYVHCGYGLLLKIFALFLKKNPPVEPAPPSLAITVLLCVHNEEKNIKRRLENLMEQDYPAGLMEILVVSDGSTDATENIAESFRGKFPVRLVRSPRLGKSGAQNLAVPQAKGEIVVLTDAEASFDPAFVREIAAPFADSAIGCATGNLGLTNRDGAVSQSQGFYWRYEQNLRRMESELGILAVASGQSMAFRRVLFREIPPFVGDDCFIPLAVVSRGYRAVYCGRAKAYDSFESEAGREFATRVRMTMRNWTGTWLFPELLNPLLHPGYAFALWSHKLLRWLGGFVLAIMALCAVLMLFHSSYFQAAAGFCFLVFLTAGAAGYVAEKKKISAPFIGTVYSFLLANAAFAVGVKKALFGERILAYRSGSLKT